MAGAARPRGLLLVLLVLFQATDAQLSRPTLRTPSNTLKLPVGPVLTLQTAATSRAAALVSWLGEQLTPRWWRETTAQLSTKGVSLRRTERILVTPALRIFLGSFTAPVPHTLKELATWLASPALPVSRVAYFPLQLWFRTQFYWAEDWQLSLARPGQTVPVLAGTGTRGRHLRRLLGLGSAAGDVAALRAQLLARVTAEAGGCAAQYTLGERLGGQRRRALLNGNATHDDPLVPLWSLNLTDVAGKLLAKMHGNGTHAGAPDWGSLLSLTLQNQASLFAAQLLSARFGVSSTITSLPSADVSAFFRAGVETDVGFDDFLRLAPATAGRRRLAQDASAPAPSPLPSPLLDADEALLALELPAYAPLPPNTLRDLLGFLTLLQSHAGEAAALLAPLVEHLASFGQLTSIVSLLVTPIVSIILGQLTFSIPTTVDGLAAALKEPTLNALLRKQVDFVVTASLVVNLVFFQNTPTRVTPINLLGRRRLLQAATPATPDALLGSVNTLLASHGASLRVQELLASFSTLKYDTASVQLYTGLLSRQALRKTSTLRKHQVTDLLHGAGNATDWLHGLHHLEFDTSLAKVTGSAGFKFFAVTLSANEGLTVKLLKKPGAT